MTRTLNPHPATRPARSAPLLRTQRLAAGGGGAVQLKQGGRARVDSAQITGDLPTDALRGTLAASGNGIDGNLQAMANRGGLALIANRMGGALQCKGNLPAPTGDGNTGTIEEDPCCGL